MFVRWELRRDEPMLDMRLFANRSFSAGSVALAMLFFAMAGTVFLQAQYLQFILGYTPLAAGVALVPAALGMMLGTGVGAHLAGQFGGRVAVATGTLVAAAGVAVQAAFIDGTSYVPTGVGLVLFGLGAGIAMPAATDLIMATLPPARAGVGSAVNDTVRELGGALGVAVIGSVAASSYASNLHGQVDHLPADVRAVVTDNIGAALTVSGHLGANGDPARRRRPRGVRHLDDQLALGRCRPRRRGDRHRLDPPPQARTPPTATPHHGQRTATPRPRRRHASHPTRHRDRRHQRRRPAHDRKPVMTATTPLAPAEPTPATSSATDSPAGAPRGHIGRIVTLTIVGGALAALLAVAGPFAGAEEHVITGSVLAVLRRVLGAARPPERPSDGPAPALGQGPRGRHGGRRAVHPRGRADRQRGRMGVAAGDPGASRSG